MLLGQLLLFYFGIERDSNDPFYVVIEKNFKRQRLHCGLELLTD